MKKPLALKTVPSSKEIDSTLLKEYSSDSFLILTCVYMETSSELWSLNTLVQYNIFNWSMYLNCAANFSSSLNIFWTFSDISLHVLI